MTSPFKSMQNARLVFQVPVKAGNPNASGNFSLTTESIVVEAYLKFQSNRAKDDRPEGIPVTANAFKGRVVQMGDDPQVFVLDSRIKPGMSAEAQIMSEKGRFTLDVVPLHAPYGRIGLVGEVTEQAGGTTISGWFVRK